MNLLAKAYLTVTSGRDFTSGFIQQEHDATALWPETYDLTSHGRAAAKRVLHPRTSQ